MREGGRLPVRAGRWDIIEAIEVGFGRVGGRIWPGLVGLGWDEVGIKPGLDGSK